MTGSRSGSFIRCSPTFLPRCTSRRPSGVELFLTQLESPDSVNQQTALAERAHLLSELAPDPEILHILLVLLSFEPFLLCIGKVLETVVIITPFKLILTFPLIAMGLSGVATAKAPQFIPSFLTILLEERNHRPGASLLEPAEDLFVPVLLWERLSHVRPQPVHDRKLQRDEEHRCEALRNDVLQSPC
jgi:hypothetical protein